MITAVDTNVLIDVFGPDPVFGSRSANALRQALEEGAVCACEIVWTETASTFETDKAFISAMTLLGVEFSPLNQQAALVASNAWREYRRSGGKRQRVAADFLIGAHALTNNARLLTRDKGFYRSYFKDLNIFDPSKSN